jgi:hypothetical protein
MAGAGGGYTCAAYIPFTQIDRTRTIIDQTNYWYIADSEIEALYITGLLNSSALDSIIADFQPEGAQGRRHVHKLPYAVTPRFDAENPMHISVAITTQAIIGEVMDRQFVFDLVAPTARNLGPRRRRVREFIGQLPGYSDYEEACRGVYNV